MPLYQDEAVVLRTFPLGEADRIIVALTKQHGKVRAVAKGVRRLKSRFGGRLEPFMRVHALFATGKSLDVISQAVSLGAYAGPISADYVTYEYANLMVETADALTGNEYQGVQEQYQLLISALASLSRHAHSPELIGLAYVMRALALAGWMPCLDRCVVCGDSKNIAYFSPASGGVMCTRDHTTDAHKLNIQVSEQLLALVQGDWDRVDGMLVSNQLLQAVAAWSEYYLERPLRSLRFAHASEA